MAKAFPLLSTWIRARTSWWENPALFGSSTTPGASRGPLTASASAQLDESLVERFGQLPLRFNGRMTTFAEYSPNAQWLVGFGEGILDWSGAPVSPSRWLLATLSDHPDPNLRSSIHLPPPLVQPGAAPPPGSLQTLVHSVAHPLPLHFPCLSVARRAPFVNRARRWYNAL